MSFMKLSIVLNSQQVNTENKCYLRTNLNVVLDSIFILEIMKNSS